MSTTTPAATAPAVAPAAAPVAAVPGATAEESEEKKVRTQLSAILGIDISQARCATHLKQNLGDPEIDAEVKPIRVLLAAAIAADPTNVVVQDGFRAQIAELSKKLIRVSGETPIAIAVIWDDAVKELLQFGMDQAILAGRKIVDTCHLHVPSANTLAHYPIYHKCNAWSGYTSENELEIKVACAAKNKKIKEARDAKKAAAALVAGAAVDAAVPAKAAPAAVKAVAPVAAAVDATDAGDSVTKTTFDTYVDNALKTVRNDAPYKEMRVSHRLREYLSELVAEGIARIALLGKIIVQQVMDVRTMNAAHVKAVINMLLADEGRNSEQIASVAVNIDAKLDIFKKHLDAEKTKKADSITDEVRLENTKKKRATDLERTKKQREAHLARGLAIESKLKTLSVE